MIQTKLVIHSQDYLRLINPDNITYCKSDNCYTDIFLDCGERILISKSLTKFSKELDSDRFIRVSQSYIININHIKLIDKKKKWIELINQTRIQFTITIKQLLYLINTEEIVNKS